MALRPLNRLQQLLKSFPVLRYFASKSSNVSHKAIPFKSRVAEGALVRDSARAQKFLSGLHPHGPAAFRSRASVNPEHRISVIDAGVTYTLPISIGNPAQDFNLLIDTGSSNTWVGAAQTYNETSTSRNTGKAVHTSYGSGEFSGTEYTDLVSLGPGLAIADQSIGVASSTRGFSNGVDGILGIGPVDLTAGTTSGETSVPTVTDNLYKLGIIQTESIGISYAPTLDQGIPNGEMTFGTVDNAKYTGQIEYVPITESSPANRYWGIDQSITYGNGTPILSQTAGIVDTGTTLLLLATDAFRAYKEATGGVLDRSTGLLTITQQQYDNLESLYFNIGNATFELTPNAQIWPRAMNKILNGDPDKIYLVTGDLGNNSGSGLDFINGFAFLQRFYSVYDTSNSRVGIAATEYTNATTN